MPNEPAARVVLYTTDWCSHCWSAKDLLARRGIAFEEVDAERRWGPSFRDELFRLTGQVTVPQILIDGVPVGGNAELVRLDESGELRRLLEDAP